jgi:hypothetical protein
MGLQWCWLLLLMPWLSDCCTADTHDSWAATAAVDKIASSSVPNASSAGQPLCITVHKLLVCKGWLCSSMPCKQRIVGPAQDMDQANQQ